jgi:hypothetical protein
VQKPSASAGRIDIRRILARRLPELRYGLRQEPWPIQAGLALRRVVDAILVGGDDGSASPQHGGQISRYRGIIVLRRMSRPC